VRGEKGR